MSEFYVNLSQTKKRWLVTGAAGFIGTNLVKKLIDCKQNVVGFDNFSTGLRSNIEFLKDYAQSANGEFTFYEGDLRRVEDCQKVMNSIDVILHNAALGSVPRSIEKPLDTHDSNVTGFINILTAAKDAGIKRFVYASSSSVYGDEPTLPKVESRLGRLLSPYAASKYINEIYAQVFATNYGIETIGLRYFNVFGPHQQPDGPYAAVIPKWLGAMLDGKPIHIFGDGETSRDFCFVENVVQVNLKAAITTNPKAINQEYNVAFHRQTSLNQLYNMIKAKLCSKISDLNVQDPIYEDFRAGDIRHSLADISKAQELLDYQPTDDIGAGMEKSITWYIQNHQSKRV